MVVQAPWIKGTALSGSHWEGLNKDTESLEMASFCQTPRGKKESSQLATFLTLTERPWPQPLKHWKEEVGGLRGSPKDSQVFSTWPVSLKFYLLLRRQHSLILINSTLCVPSWRTKTVLSLRELKVECISLEWRQIWLREGRGLLALGRFHFASRGGNHVGRSRTILGFPDSTNQCHFIFNNCMK